MTTTTRLFTVALAALLAPLGAQPEARRADPVALGKPAPALEVQEWLHGDPVPEWEDGHVYVIDFWATWCGPCIQSIPHLNGLAAEYGDRPVTFIGLSSPDSRGNSLEKTRRFVEEGAPAGPVKHKMEYTIAWARGRGTWTQYAQSGWDQSIPHAFIIDAEGVLAWHGHPAEMDDALRQIVAGEFDAAEYAAGEARRAELQAKARPMIAEISKLLRAGDVDGAIRIAGEVAEMDYTLFANVASWRYERLVQVGRADEARAYGEDLVTTRWKDSVPALQGFAHKLATTITGADLALALRAAERANELAESRNAAVLETLARVHYARGEVDNAREFQAKAVEVAPESAKGDYQKTLESFKD